MVTIGFACTQVAQAEARVAGERKARPRRPSNIE